MRPAVLLDIFGKWLDALLNFWDILSSPIGYNLEGLIVANPLFVPIGAFLYGTGLNNFTWLEFMLGAGIVLYIGYQFFTWVLNLIT